MERTRAQWEAFAGEHDCCLEPVLDLDEALDSELVRAREMVVEHEQPGATEPVRLLGVPVKLSAHAGRRRAAARAGARRAHRRGARARRATATRRSPRSRSPARSPGRAGRGARGSFLALMAPRRPAEDERAGRALRRSRRARSSTTCARGCSARATTSCARRATWPTTRPTTSSGSELIKRLQEERFMPLRRSGVLRRTRARAALIELEDRILERAVERTRARQRRRGAPPLRDPARTCSSASRRSAC